MLFLLSFPPMFVLVSKLPRVLTVTVLCTCYFFVSFVFFYFPFYNIYIFFGVVFLQHFQFFFQRFSVSVLFPKLFYVSTYFLSLLSCHFLLRPFLLSCPLPILFQLSFLFHPFSTCQKQNSGMNTSFCFQFAKDKNQKRVC